MIFTMNVIWKGCYPEHYPIPSELEHGDPGVTSKCKFGVATFTGDNKSEVLQKIDKFINQKAVDYGEEGGSFKVKGAFEGDCKDLMDGETEFIATKTLYEDIAEYWY